MNPFSIRKYYIIAIFGVTIFIYVLRLFYLQIIDVSLKNSSDNNSRRFVTQYPARGIVYDRNGKIIVYNEAAYDLMISPIQLKAFDTSDFCRILNITPKYVRDNIKNARAYSYYKPSIFLKQLSNENYALLEEKLYKFPGFFVQSRTLRKYNRKIAAHMLGYVGEVDERDIKKEEYYKLGDYIGVSGLEKFYEKELRGKKGVSIFLVDVHNRIKGSFQNGKYDTTAIVGKDLTCTIDADLQEYAEMLMQNMSGSVVAIEPSTGEILTMVSAPGYDPELLVGRQRNNNYMKLLNDPLKPLFNRAVMAKYPPGSTYKLVNSLIGLHEGVLKTETRYGCSMGFHAGRLTVGCHSHPSPLNLTGAIATSCNAYFCSTFRSIIDNKDYSSTETAYRAWYNYARSMGLGHKLNSDIPQELPGYIPSVEFYDRYHGSGRWKALSVISLAIGQGELGITVLQMANVAATIANKGYYYTPHLVKKIRGEKDIAGRFTLKNTTPFDTSLYSIVIEGMYQAVHGAGTAGVARMKNVVVCGKTGTAENPHGLDHSIFICFAPRNNPKIAIASFVENAGFGSTWALPIARLMIEKYLKQPMEHPELEERLLNYERKPWLTSKKKR